MKPWPTATTSLVVNPGALIHGPEHAALCQARRAAVQASIATFTQVGAGTVRTLPCFPTTSTMRQRIVAWLDMREQQRRHLGSAESAADPNRKNGPIPQSLSLFRHPVRQGVPAPAGATASSPWRILIDSPLFTRLMPAANSGASSPYRLPPPPVCGWPTCG
jgi:hypothetical protein